MVLPDFEDYVRALGIDIESALLNWTETADAAGREWGVDGANAMMGWLEDNRHEKMADMMGVDMSLHGDNHYQFGGEVLDLHEIRFGDLRFTDEEGRTMDAPMHEFFQDWKEGMTVEPVSRRFVSEGDIVLREEDLRDELKHLVSKPDMNHTGPSREKKIDLIIEELRR